MLFILYKHFINSKKQVIKVISIGGINRSVLPQLIVMHRDFFFSSENAWTNAVDIFDKANLSR